MQGKKFSALFIADPISVDEIDGAKAFYENIYSQLSPLKEQVINKGSNQSTAYTKGITHSIGSTFTENRSKTESSASSKAESKSSNDTKQPWLGKRILNFGFGTESTANKIIHAPIDAVNLVHNKIVGGIGDVGSKMSENLPLMDDESKSKTSRTIKKGTRKATVLDSGSRQVTKGVTKTKTTTKAETEGTSSASSKNTTHNVSNSQTKSSSSSRQFTQENKFIQNQLQKLDLQFERLNKGEGIGMWNAGAFFFSDEQQNSVVAANIYSGLLKGEQTRVEKSLLRTYTSSNSLELKKLVRQLKRYDIPKIIVPQLNYINSLSSVVNTEEMAMQFCLPQKSIVGLDVVEVAPFGNNVYKISENSNLRIGNLYNYEKEFNIDFYLDYQKFTGHIFVTGSTGSGKSNVTYNLLQKLVYRGIKFLVIEPAKGEYKNVFGNRGDVNVFGTNPKYSKLLQINPFSFPQEIHVYEHIDRLLEILNSCWPMYAAMPAILKEGIEKAYIKKGWDLKKSDNYMGDRVFPTFRDLAQVLPEIINNSGFSQEMISNYTGALVTRVNSMTNGLTDLIFSKREICNKELFDENTIVDLSRVASSETKSLLMGILFMKLQEYRMSTNTVANSDLKHVAVIEEAHNLLKRTSGEQAQDTANLQGKSVEMISNAIAEMRTYGQGFILADQAPGLLDPAVIRNTNTKICLRLPSQDDRELVGKAMNLSEDQIDELAKLKTGVAAVYQNDWQEAVLCKFDYFEQPKELFRFQSRIDQQHLIRKFLAEQLITNRIGNSIDEEELKKCLRYKGYTHLINNILSGSYSENQIAQKLYFLLDVNSILEILNANNRDISTYNGWVKLYKMLFQKKWGFESNSYAFLEIISLTLKHMSQNNNNYQKFYNSFIIQNQLRQIQ